MAGPVDGHHPVARLGQGGGCYDRALARVLAGESLWRIRNDLTTEAVLAAAAAVTPQQRQMNEDAEASSLAELKAKGVQFTEPVVDQEYLDYLAS